MRVAERIGQPPAVGGVATDGEMELSGIRLEVIHRSIRTLMEDSVKPNTKWTSVAAMGALAAVMVLGFGAVPAMAQSDSRWGNDPPPTQDRSGSSYDQRDQNGPNDGRNDSNYGRNDSGYGRNDSGYGRNDSGYGRNDSGYGRNDSGYGRNDSGYRNGSGRDGSRGRHSRNRGGRRIYGQRSGGSGGGSCGSGGGSRRASCDRNGRGARGNNGWGNDGGQNGWRR